MDGDGTMNGQGTHGREMVAPMSGSGRRGRVFFGLGPVTRAVLSSAAALWLLGTCPLVLVPDRARAANCQPIITDPTLVVPQPSDPKPALGAQFVDPTYGTCFRRISDAAVLGYDHPTPTYSQLQAWNADQSKIMLVSGDILNADYTWYKKVYVGNFRWSPIYPNIGYYSQSNSFEQIDISTGMNGTATTVRTFPEYPGGLERGNEQEDLSRDGRFVVLEGYRSSAGRDTIRVAVTATNGSSVVTSAGGFGDVLTRMPVYSSVGGLASGTKVLSIANASSLTMDHAFTGPSGTYVFAFGASEAFVFDVLANRKGTTVPGWSGFGLCGGIDDMLMSPSGKYALLHWGSGGSGSTCNLQAYDTSMAYAGEVSFGRGHFDLTVDQNGVEWCVQYTADATDGITGAYIAKYRLPDGFDRYQAGDLTAAVKLTDWPYYAGGGHISGRAFGKGFVVASADYPPSGVSRAPYTNELVKIYLDSRIATEGTPHVERLTNHRSDEAWVASQPNSTCPMSSYWAQPHATLSRDGTKLLFGSTWGQNCTAEAYVMDLFAGTSSDTTPPAATRDLQAR